MLRRRGGIRVSWLLNPPFRLRTCCSLLQTPAQYTWCILCVDGVTFVSSRVNRTQKRVWSSVREASRTLNSDRVLPEAPFLRNFFGAADASPQRPGGREPESDSSGRIGVSSGDPKSGWCGKRRSIFATVPAVSTPLARSAPPARCPGPISGTIYHVPLLRSPTTTPEPLPLLPLCPTALCHAMLWYTPSMRTRVPSFGQTFPNKVGPCEVSCLF